MIAPPVTCHQAEAFIALYQPAHVRFRYCAHTSTGTVRVHYTYPVQTSLGPGVWWESDELWQVPDRSHHYRLHLNGRQVYVIVSGRLTI